ncbi:hypothetical protein [Paractinoplanes atraurantiacus]|uniref:Uncharacterized protein n=1 Tax=Paractinoplanes atraurantiacus TaxID=1036182 RepID=A0A285J0Q8_9ACTN|nr:hypothetical protein [Actinoplanes atraurantiacus]SNY53824.1 hypothetical protein SAMN05421748_114182 [Actinoplanes atraurantiacus]
MKRQRPGNIVAACGMLAAGGALFAGEVLLSADKYFADMRSYEQAVRDGLVKNDTAFAAVGVTIHLAMAAVGVLAGVALVVLARHRAHRGVGVPDGALGRRVLPERRCGPGARTGVPLKPW